jgi:hypothetical protein
MINSYRAGISWKHTYHIFGRKPRSSTLDLNMLDFCLLLDPDRRDLVRNWRDIQLSSSVTKPGQGMVSSATKLPPIIWCTLVVVPELISSELVTTQTYEHSCQSEVWEDRIESDALDRRLRHMF